MVLVQHDLRRPSRLTIDGCHARTRQVAIAVARSAGARSAGARSAAARSAARRRPHHSICSRHVLGSSSTPVVRALGTDPAVPAVDRCLIVRQAAHPRALIVATKPRSRASHGSRWCVTAAPADGLRRGDAPAIPVDPGSPKEVLEGSSAGRWRAPVDPGSPMEVLEASSGGGWLAWAPVRWLADGPKDGGMAGVRSE